MLYSGDVTSQFQVGALRQLVAMAAADFWFVNSYLIFFADSLHLYLFAQTENGAGNVGVQAQMRALIGGKNVRHRAGLT